MPRGLTAAALIALAVALGVTPIGAGARSTLLTGNRPALVTSHERPERVCTRLEVRALFFGFVDAFNRGDLRRLNRLFALEPGFEWHSTHAPGERFDNAAKNRSTLIPYFRERHAMGERLKVRSLRIKGRGVQYSLIRSADDLEPTRYDGKAAALLCEATQTRHRDRRLVDGACVTQHRTLRVHSGTLAQARISILVPLSVYAIRAYATEMIEIDPQLERVARLDIPDDQAHVVGVSIAPSGLYAVVMLIAGEGPAAEFDETVAERVGQQWIGVQSGTPSSVVYASDHRGIPLCNYMEPLPLAVERVVVLDRGSEYEVPVEQGYFLYVAWKRDTDGDNTTDPPAAEVVRTIRASPLG